MSTIPSNFKNLSQIDNLEEIYVDRIPHFMTRFLSQYGGRLHSLRQVTFDRSIKGLQPVTSLLERKKPLDKISFWCGSSKVPLSRVLEMCYTKVSKQTVILMHDLTVDVTLEGFSQQLLPPGSVPPMRIGAEPSEEEKLGMMPDVLEMTMKEMKNSFRCTRHFIKLSCMQFHIEDKITKSKLVIEA